MEYLKIDKYRGFVRSYLEKRAPRARGEVTKLATFLGVHPTFVSQVLGDTKEFSAEQAMAVANYLELGDSEKKYFLLLVQRDRAASKDLREFYTKELQAFRQSMTHLEKQLAAHRSLSDADRSVFYASWIYSAIRLFCSIGKGKTVEEVCEHFDLNRAQALSYLDFLLSRELIKYEQNRYQLGSQHTHLEPKSPFAVRHHMNWRMKALQRHDNLEEYEVAFTAPMSISHEDYMRVREKIHQCIKESIAIAKDSDAEDVAFLTIDWLKV